MTRRVWTLVRMLVAASAVVATTAASGASPSGSEHSASSKKPAEPFYRKYLVPGNRLDDQIREQEKRVEESPDDANLRNDFGNLLAARHFPRDAAEQYEIAAKLDKSNFLCLYNLGLLDETQDRIAEAIHAYKRSIDRKKGFPPVHFRLGRLYEKQGSISAAIAEYSTALKIDPTMRDPRRNPLVVDTQLFYRASLNNYASDMAAASLTKDAVYADEARFHAVPVDRPVMAQEAAPADEAETVGEPRQIGVSDAAGTVSPTEAAPATHRPGARAGSQEQTGTPMVGRPRSAQTPPRRTAPRGGTPLVAAPPGSSMPPPPPPVEAAPPQTEPETNPPETMPEPTPAPPSDEEPS